MGKIDITSYIDFPYREYGENRYHNMLEEKKHKLKEYQKKYREAKNSKHNSE